MELKNNRRWSWALFVLLVLAGLPFLLPSYQLRIFTEVIIFSLFAVSYNMLLGYAGLISFGHAMSFGFGAFCVANLLNHASGLPLMAAVVLAAGLTTMVGFLVGCLLLRVKGTPFALLTLAFNALFFKHRNCEGPPVLCGSKDDSAISRIDLPSFLEFLRGNGFNLFVDFFDD